MNKYKIAIVISLLFTQLSCSNLNYSQSKQQDNILSTFMSEPKKTEWPFLKTKSERWIGVFCDRPEIIEKADGNQKNHNKCGQLSGGRSLQLDLEQLDLKELL